MIEIEVPKDINKYEAKLISSFTTRQTACLAGGLLLAVPTFMFLKERMPTDVVSIIVCIILAPFICFGWIKPYGMKFEQFLRSAFISNVLSPKVRKYVTINQYEFVENPEFNEQTVKDQMKMMTRKEMRKEMDTKIKTDIKYYI